MKFDGYRALAYLHGRRVQARLAQREGPDRPLPRRREGARQGGQEPERRRSTARSAGSTRPGRTSFSELQQGTGPLVFYAFDLLELDGEPLVDLPLTERKAQLRKLLDKRVTTVAFSDDFDDGDALFEVAAGAGARGDRRQARRQSRTSQGRRSRDWLKIKTAERAGVRRRRLHARRRPSRRHVRRARARRSTTATSCATSATSAPASTTPRSTSCSRLLRAAASRHAAVPGRAEDAARPQGRRAVGRAAARRAGALRRVDARRPSPPPRLPRHPRGQERGRGDARAADRAT